MTSGSDKRHRGVTLSARFSDEEAAVVRQAADRAGLSVASLIRAGVLDEDRRPRAARRPPLSLAQLSLILLALGPVADSLRQIAGKAEIGHNDPGLKEAFAQLADLSGTCLQLMGRGRVRAPSAIAWERESLAVIFARAVSDQARPARPRLPFPGGPSP